MVEEGRERIKNVIYKALYYANNSLDVSGDIPSTREESRFLIGLVFRYTLMSVIVDSQRRQNLGVLEHDPNLRLCRNHTTDNTRTGRACCVSDTPSCVRFMMN